MADIDDRHAPLGARLPGHGNVRTRPRPDRWFLRKLFSRRFAYPRDAAIDAGRFVCCLAVVLIHTADSSHFSPAGTPTPTGADSLEFGHVLDQLARFAVPYFFVASGFFLRPTPKSGPLGEVMRVLVKIGPVYCLWTLVINLLHPAALDTLGRPGAILRLLLQGGAAPHLWFLPAIAGSVALISLLRTRVPSLGLIAIGFGLFLVGLALGPYDRVIVGRTPSLMQLHFARDVFLGPVFVAFGLWLRQSDWRPSFQIALMLFALGATWQLLESYVLWRSQRDSAFGNDFVFGTLPFGLSAFLVALTWPKHVPVPRALAALGMFGLGVYAIHPLFVDGLGSLLGPQSLGARLIVAALAAGFSFASIVLIATWRPLRWAVM